MTQQPYSSQPPAGQYAYPPPAQPFGQYAPPGKPRTVWPTVIGWISIGLASLFLILALVGLVKEADTSQFTPEARQTLEDWNRNWRPVMIVANLAIYGSLLAGGVCLLQRRRIARPLHLVYGVLAILGSIPGTYLSWALMEGITTPANAPPGLKAGMAIGMKVGLVFGLLFAWAYPVFLFIWFSRRKIKDQLAGW